MNKNKSLKMMEEIIFKNNLCISQNPQGITKYWPKSYACKFYNKLLKNKYFSKGNINLLDIDSKNKNQDIFWKLIFKNLNLVHSQISKFNFKNKQESRMYNYDFDIIIMNKIPLNNYKNITENILKQLNKKGILIIEDCGENVSYILKIFFIFSYKYDIRIEDYRFHRMLRNNCLLILKNYKSNLFVNILTFEKNLLKIIYHLILEAILKVHDFISTKIN